MNRQIFQLHADVCKALANAKRLEILHILRNNEMSVGDIVKHMGIPIANVSQHLSMMQKTGILNTRRDGLKIYYRISNPKVTKVCNMMREVLLEHYIKRGNLLMNQTKKEK